MSDATDDWLVLDDGEEVVWSGEPELLGYAWVFALGVVLIPLFGVGILVIASAYLQAKHTAYVITTESVFKKTGVLSRTVTDIGHEKIQDTGYRQSAIARHFGFGTVQISTAGGSGVEMSLDHVTEPIAVQAQLDSITATRAPADDHSSGDTRGSVQIDAATIAELVEEMRATRAAMESIERRLDED